MSVKRPSTRESRAAQGELGAATRDNGRAHPITQQSRQRWEGERCIDAVADAVKVLVDEAPKLSADQLNRVAILIRPAVELAGIGKSGTNLDGQPSRDSEPAALAS